MDSFFIVLIIIFCVILLICFIYYIFTLPKRRKNKEIFRREVLLFEEKYEAENAKQNARIAGQITREKINEIANLK